MKASMISLHNLNYYVNHLNEKSTRICCLNYLPIFFFYGLQLKNILLFVWFQSQLLVRNCHIRVMFTYVVIVWLEEVAAVADDVIALAQIFSELPSSCSIFLRFSMTAVCSSISFQNSCLRCSASSSIFFIEASEDWREYGFCGLVLELLVEDKLVEVAAAGDISTGSCDSENDISSGSLPINLSESKSSITILRDDKRQAVSRTGVVIFSKRIVKNQIDRRSSREIINTTL